MVWGEGCPECTLSQAVCDEMDTKKRHTRSYSLEPENMKRDMAEGMQKNNVPKTIILRNSKRQDDDDDNEVLYSISTKEERA